MTGTLFVLGRSPLLAFSELQTYFPHARLLDSDIAYIPDTIDVSYFIATLGGTVKIASVIGTSDTIDANLLCNFFLPYVHDNKITFGISRYSAISRQVKEALKEHGVVARYVESENNELSSVVIDKQHVQEIIIVRTKDSFVIGKTLAVQDFSEWNARDWDRPAVDPQKGMLPPKVARMVVNIAKKYIKNDNPVLVDPFCGVGTILSEAQLVGFITIGADIDSGALQKAETNIEWIKQRYAITRQSIFVQSEAVLLSTKISVPIDAIVTEPFMGNPKLTEYNSKPSMDKVQNTIKGLEKLYIGSLKDWHSLLIASGIVIVALPEYNIDGKKYFVKKVIDRCENLGYTLAEGPYEYSRPQAIVKRQFYVLRKK